jgi:hypothetical protein
MGSLHECVPFFLRVQEDKRKPSLLFDSPSKVIAST